MKKYKTTFNLSIFLILAVSAILFTSCNKITNIVNNTNSNSITNKNTQNNVSNNATPKTNYTIKNYYPFKENLRLSYAGSGNEYASKDVYVDFIKGNKIQLRSINAGTTMGQVLQYENGELKLVYSRGEFYYRDDLTSLQSNANEVLLKEPLQKGTSWTLSDGRKRSITGTDVAVDTPSGKYKALEVTTTSSNSTVKDYYSINNGLVKTIFTSEGSTVTTSLKKSIPNSNVTQTIKFYYPKMTDTDVAIMFKRNTINLKTNDDIKNIFQDNFRKTLISGTQPLMSANTKINKLYLNDVQKVVYVDFSKEFITEMNAGTSMENGILTSVVNTLGNYFNVAHVKLTVDGKEYSSGHILMKKGENFKVNYNNAVEVK
ncbi:GerMN domain-containing protein [Clostridium arbusti]|uniref:GerMN domain-containing protein n=1 Tax=Clostridium arbusti TaxID=1137848 RepID=UPI000289E216|nr:GerMN domain-containing protein [Clostridium arbusti]